jgi:hypothetical protein
VVAVGEGRSGGGREGDGRCRDGRDISSEGRGVSLDGKKREGVGKRGRKKRLSHSHVGPTGKQVLGTTPPPESAHLRRPSHPAAVGGGRRRTATVGCPLFCYF